MLTLLLSTIVLGGSALLLGRSAGREKASRLEVIVGAILYLTAASGALFWLMILLTASGGSFRIGGFEGSGLVDALLATPTAVALIASQAVFGVGLMRKSRWVRWYGLLFVLGGAAVAGLSAVLPASRVLSLTLPFLATVPLGVLLLRRRGDGAPALPQGEEAPRSLGEGEDLEAGPGPRGPIPRT